MKLSRISTGADGKHMGEEPQWIRQAEIDNLKCAEIGALSWYNYFCDSKQAKIFLIEYMKGVNRPVDEINAVMKIGEARIPVQVGWIARMMSNGYQPSERFKEFFVTNFKTILSESKKIKSVAVVKEPANVVSIQDRIKDKASEEIGELEGLLDDFILSGCKIKIDFTSYFKSRSLSSVVSKKVCDHFIDRAKEFEDVLNSTDAQIKEGYSNFTKANLRKIIDFIGGIVAESNRLVGANKPVRKQRKVKEKPLAVQVAKVAYMKEFAELKLVSVAPEKIIGANQVWTYNTKTKLLAVYNTDNAKGLAIKGTTLQNYNEQSSEGKRLRKPEAVIKQVLDGGKITLKKLFDTLSTKSAKLTGRLNSDTIIVRVIK
jgi:hypothetical protein